MTVSEEIGLVWFRRDLRLEDNPAWAAATAERRYIVALYVIDPRLMTAVGPYRRRQLIASLQALDYELAEGLGGRLQVRTGRPEELVVEAASVFQVGGVYFNEDVSPFATRRDDAVRAHLDVPTQTYFGNLILPPRSVLTKKDTVSRVFSPFFKVWTSTPWDPWPAPGDDITVLDDPGEFVPRLDDRPPFFEGPNEAHTRLAEFIERVDDYDEDRDRFDRPGTSQLSVDLRFGTISPRVVATAVGDATEGRQAFMRQLAWRDWYAHLLHERPSMVDTPVSDKFAHFEWLDAPADVSAWKGGFTGYPIVDAAMRQLREEGWIHNRLRMVAASFLCKDLLVDWRIGERHFRHLLVDFDVSQNVGNWQWVAGCGPDASPYLRVFNPVTQSRKFDPTGSYLRRWVPELAALDDEMIHAPWEVDEEDLAAAGVVLGRDYPRPVVDHNMARERAIVAFKAVEVAETNHDGAVDPS